MSAVTSKIDPTQPITQPMSIKTSPGNGRFTVTVSRNIRKAPDNTLTYELFTQKGTQARVRTNANSNSGTQSASSSTKRQYKLSSSPTKKRRLNEPLNMQQLTGSHSRTQIAAASGSKLAQHA